MKTVLLWLLLSPVVVCAQFIKVTPEDTSRKRSYLVMRDGSVMHGQIIRQDSSIITVQIKGGDFSYVEADQVVRILSQRPGAPEENQFISPESASTVFVLKDGVRLPGVFVRRDSVMITVRKTNGQLTYFEPELLVRVDTVWAGSEASDGTFPNRFSPFLLLNSTAFTPEKGRFYYRNALLLYNEFDYGITSFWSVGFSFIPQVPFLNTFLDDNNYYALNGFLPQNPQLFTRLSIPIGQRFRLGLNATYMDKAGDDYYNRGPFTFQALATIGSTQHNVTLGYGFSDWGKFKRYYYNGQGILAFIESKAPSQSSLSLGIMQKVSPYLSLISDNRIKLGDYQYYYFDTGERASLSFALRFDRRRHAFDLGVYGLVYRDNAKIYGPSVRLLGYLGYNLILGRK